MTRMRFVYENKDIFTAPQKMQLKCLTSLGFANYKKSLDYARLRATLVSAVAPTKEMSLLIKLSTVFCCKKFRL